MKSQFDGDLLFSEDLENLSFEEIQEKVDEISSTYPGKRIDIALFRSENKAMIRVSV